MEAHPNRRYFIFKSIILNNLFGVDIMEEAVEICKLRLFLELAAQVEPDQTHANLGIETLPDVDFNIKAGNTLVGFTDYEDVKRAVMGELQTKLDFGDHMQAIDSRAALADEAYEAFRRGQTEGAADSSNVVARKDQLRARLSELGAELDRYLAAEYGIETGHADEFALWRKAHQPFHWFAEFYGIVSDGGFDVIVGNPPYRELSEVRKEYKPLGYSSESCGNLYALCLERGMALLKRGGWMGMIVQQPLVSTMRMETIRDLLAVGSDLIAVSTYDDRPSKLFDGMQHARIAIVVNRKGEGPAHLSVTRYNKWYSEERPLLFDRLRYTEGGGLERLKCFPKIGSELEHVLVAKVMSAATTLGSWIAPHQTEHRIYYKITGVGHWFTITTRPPRFLREGRQDSSSREAALSFPDRESRDRAFVLLNSSLFYWYYQVRTNCRDFNPSDYRTFPVPASLADEDFSALSDRLQRGLDESSEMNVVKHSKTGEIQVESFRPGLCKPVIDDVDRVLSSHYELDAFELDFVLNYDIKYRLGLGS